MLMVLLSLIMAAVSGVVMVEGFMFEGFLGFLISAIFAFAQLANHSPGGENF